MTNANQNLLLCALMFATGVGIPVMGALNAGLGQRLGSLWAAGFLLFALGAVVTGIAMALMGMPRQGWLVAPSWFYIGGLFVAFYVLSVTWSAPRIGVANAVFFTLVGQIVAAGLIDQFGLFGAMRSPLTVQRLAGMALMLIGLFFARRAA